MFLKDYYEFGNQWILNVRGKTSAVAVHNETRTVDPVDSPTLEGHASLYILKEPALRSDTNDFFLSNKNVS